MRSSLIRAACLCVVVLLLFSSSVFAAGSPDGPDGKNIKAQTIVSRVVKTEDGKAYLEVDGKPFLMGHVQNCGAQQLYCGKNGSVPYSQPKPVDYLENMFEKTKALNYSTISLVLKWNEIEPETQGVFDWTLIDKYVDWADKYDLRLDINWFGTNACGGARLTGRDFAPWSWSSQVPQYLQDHDKYWGNGYNRYAKGQWYADIDIHCPWLPDGTGHDTDAGYLFSCERNAVARLFDHLAVKDVNHRTIAFQVWNEPNGHWDWETKKPVLIDLMSRLAKVVKDSDYVVATRVNMGGGVIDSDVSAAPYIDFVGCDPYVTSIVQMVAALKSGISNMPYIAENYGNASNTSSMVIAALANRQQAYIN